MTLQDLLDHWGTVSAVARALGASDSTVSEWREQGVPDGRQYQAQLATKGRLQADKPALRAQVPRIKQRPAPVGLAAELPT